MEDKKNDTRTGPENFALEESPVLEEPVGTMPELTLDEMAEPDLSALREESTEAPLSEVPVFEDLPTPEILPELSEEEPVLAPEMEPELLSEEEIPLVAVADQDDWVNDERSVPEIAEEKLDLPVIPADFSQCPTQEFSVPDASQWNPPVEEAHIPEPPVTQSPAPSERPRAPRKGRPKRKKGYGLFGLPHLLATVVWLAIIVMIGTSLGRMFWVCAADVLAFGRESKKVSVTITSNDTIDDIAEKLHDAELVRYPGLFKLYASIAVDDGDILPGTFEMDTLYDYHALVVQMGPRSSNRAVVEDLLIPEGLNCRQIFELLEQKNICTVKELEEYAANGEFSDFWFLEGVERGDKYCLEGFLFPDTYDFYAHSTPREALGKMLLGFEKRITEEIYSQIPALNERLSAMMRSKGCSEEHIAENQLDLRDLLTVASLIEEETASSQESPTIASVIFNRFTEDQVFERYLGIDAAIIYVTGDSNNIDTSLDHPYNTYKYPGLTPGPISNPGLESILAALNFADTPYYYYVLNPETGLHQFSKTLEEHERWIEEFRGTGE